MQWPWVSRGRFDDVVRRLEQSESERLQLFHRLMEILNPKPIVREPVAVVESDKEESKSAPMRPSNPIDAVLHDFGKKFPKGTTPDSRFLARGR